MSRDTSSYDLIAGFGLLYDSIPMYAARGDIAFYAEEASKTTGRILELGCGTGRILLPTARAGRAIDGLDRSEEMLARCRVRLAGEPPAVQKRVTLHRADIRTFSLGERYDLITAPFRVLQGLAAIDDQLRLLENVRRHLAPGGRFIFDVFNPNFLALAAANGTEQEDTPEQSLPDGRVFRRTARVVRVRWIAQISDVELIYYVSRRGGGNAERHVQPLEMRWYLSAELRHLLARAGFEVEWAYGDFNRGPLVDGSPEQVVCATPS